MRILLVEDNQPLSDWLAKALRQARYIVDCIHDGVQADNLLAAETYDLVVLDLGLPRLGGQEVLRRLRARGSDVPVIILTANNSLEGRVGGLDVGADDYLAKPFEMVELEARVRALLRRTGKRNPQLACGNLVYDSNRKTFFAAERQLELTPREHAVLETLITRMGKTVNKRSLVATLCTLDADISQDAIEIYVHRLRKKLEGSSDAVIVTLRGLGYLLKPRDPA